MTRGGVRHLGVDEHLGDVTATEPRERVVDERPGVTAASTRRVDGHPLDVPGAVGRTAECVGRGAAPWDGGIGGGVDQSEPARRCGRQDGAEPTGVEGGVRTEGPSVDCCGRGQVAASRSPPGPTPDHGQGRPQVVAQHTELLVQCEPGGGERVESDGVERRGQDPGDAPGVQFVDHVADTVTARQAARVGRAEHHGTGGRVPLVAEQSVVTDTEDLGRTHRSSSVRGYESVGGGVVFPGLVVRSRRYAEAVSLLVVTDERCALHFAGAGHPERPERVDAVRLGLEEAERAGALEFTVPEPASDDALERVHDAGYVGTVRSFCLTGGGNLDPDTAVVPESLEAAQLAAGSGLHAIERLTAGRADGALCAVRPPGHHARPGKAMGFCLFNNVAVTAAALAATGARVLIVDVDVHHGNGTQEIFWDDPNVAYASIHQWPWYPGTGRAEETGGPGAPGGICNVPLPAGATGDVYDAALDTVIVPFAERFAPDWLCISLGFDAHRADPLAEIGLSAGDFGRIVARLLTLVPTGRWITLLEGGYDLAAIAASTAASVAAMTGMSPSGESPTSGGPGRAVVDGLARPSER